MCAVVAYGGGGEPDRELYCSMGWLLLLMPSLLLAGAGYEL